MANHTQDFARLLAAIGDDDLSDQALDAAECALIDHLGVALYGSGQPWSSIIAEHAIAEAGDAGKVPLYGRSERLRAGFAARVNGTAGHSYELDDLYEHGSVHPGAVVMPAVLAFGAERAASGRDVLRAIVTGYEAMGRVAVAAASQMTPFHTTGTHGVFGSAAGVATLAGFDAGQLTNVFGVVGSLSAGLKAFQSGGGEVKRLHPGRSAEAGIIAVQLCERGFTGPRDVLENERGFFSAFGGKNAAYSLLSSKEDGFVIENLYYKPYPSCALTHPVINAVKALVSKHGIEPGNVSRVLVGTPERGLANSIASPTDTMSVQYSIEACVGLALLGLDEDPTAFGYDRYMGSDAPQLAGLVKVVTDDEAQSVYPQKMAARAEIECADGTVYSVFESGLSGGDADLRRKSVESKFRRLTNGLLMEDGQKRVIDAVRSLRSGGSVDEILDEVGNRSIIAGQR